MVAWWQPFLDWLGIAGGVASLYGAWVSWRQTREAKRARAAVAEVEERVRLLGRRLTLQQVVAETISSLRQAETRLSLNAAEQVAAVHVHLREATRGLGRLLTSSEARGLRSRASRNRMRREIQRLSVGLIDLTFPVSPADLQALLATVIDVTDDLEQVLVQLAEKMGAEHADSE